MSNWQEFKEHAVRSGVGTALCVMFESETKYHFLCPTDSLPSFIGEPNTIEYSSTTNKAIYQIEGKATTNSVTISTPYNLDAIALCKKIKGKRLSYAYIDLDDFSAACFTATAAYSVADVGTDDIKLINITLTVNSYEEDIREDIYDFYMDTVTFSETLPEVVVMSTGETAQTFKLGLSTGATATVTPTDGSFATASISSDTLTITAKSKGSQILNITATATDLASNERVIKVIVK